MKYCAIEGSCYAGKTTSLSLFEHLGIPTLQEPKIDDAWSRPPDSLEKYKRIIDAYISREAQRADEISRMPSSVDLLIADRSILSPIVFEAFAARFGLGNHDDRLRAHEYAVKQADAAVMAGNLILPNCMVIMGVGSPQEFYRRVAERGAVGSPVDAYHASKYWADQTYQYAKTILAGSAAKYDVSDANAFHQNSIANVSACVLDLVQQLPINRQPVAISELQNQYLLSDIDPR